MACRSTASRQWRRVGQKQQLCYLVTIPEFGDGVAFHIVKNNFRVEVTPETVFASEVITVGHTAPPPVDTVFSSQTNVLPNVFGGTGLREEIAQLRAEGIEVDDDNEPLPEDAIPAPADPEGMRYEHTTPTYCPRRANNDLVDSPGRWVHHRWDEIAEKSELDIFRMCMPEDFIREVVLPATNVHLFPHLTMQEFYKWLGCHFFMSCFQGIDNRDAWWSHQPISMFEGAPFRLHEYMSGTRFKDITAHIRFTNKATPTVASDGFVDRFHEVRQMLDAFNDHYDRNYVASWLSCLDESMSSWLSKFCPGFMVVPRKPHPFGNEYHTIADGDDGKPIMFRIKLVEGKDRPKKADGSWAFPSEYDRLQKTTKTMMEMTKPLHGTGKVVVGDSGFCVREGVIALHKKGVHFQAYVKKRSHWPKGVPGDHIDGHLKEAPLGYCETLVQQFDDVRFLVHCCRDKDWVSKIMSTHGMLDIIQDHPTYRKVDGSWKTFKYSEPFSRYSRAKHWVDDINNCRHDPIGLEEVWQTKWWAMHQFTFICSVAEVNAVHSLARGKREATKPQLEFCRKLAKQMMTNMIDVHVVPEVVPMRTRALRNVQHLRLKRGIRKGSWNPYTRCFREVKTDYLRLQCGTCGMKTRDYCSCDPATPLCIGCHTLHVNGLN